MDPEAYQFEDAPTPPPQDAGSSPVNRHTKFLDLTNGEDGERDDDPYADDDEDDEEDDDDDQMMMVPPGMAGDTHHPSVSMSASTNFESTPPKSRKGKADSSTLVRVVETGQEATGRWTKEEHEAFLSALKMYGKEWKKVAAKVKTRTVVQTRTHAQKYFQKLQKAVESGDPSVDDIPMGTGSRSISGKKKRSTPSSIGKATGSPPTSLLRQNSVASAAHLISHMSDMAASDSPYIHGDGFARPQEPANAKSSSMFSPAHGFTTYASSNLGGLGSSTDYSFQAGPSKPVGFPMKIVAPEHDSATKRGKFPEPSPAACGKRKLAEIAAARMLAGVAGFEGFGGGGDSKSLLGSSDEDGTATPPPEEEVGTAKAHMKEIPAPPIIPASNNGPSKPGFGLSLQIVNPESLGVSYESEQKRRKDGHNSPQTPWEGQLAALVRCVE